MAETDTYVEELDTIAARLGELLGKYAEIQARVTNLENAIAWIDKCWSRSNLGYQARVYYGDFEEPPADEIFDVVQGIPKGGAGRTATRWAIRREHEVRQEIFIRAGSVLTQLQEYETDARQIVLQQKEAIVSILTSCLNIREDAYLSSIKKRVEDTSPPSAKVLARSYVASREVRTNDYVALNEGPVVAPHQVVLGEVKAIDAPYVCAQRLAECARNAADHLRRLPSGTPMPVTMMQQLGSRVFIGHGGSPQWRELKDYIQDKLALPVDEFSRVPVAGLMTGARLAQMLNSAAMAFLVMTAEDETPDGKYVARQNVIHEVGLFQGKLGFEKAIVMLEEGCEEFSNIHGLNQVRYPKGNISAKFHEVRDLLEREGLL